MTEQKKSLGSCNHQFREDVRKEASAGFTYTMTKLWCERKYKYNKRGVCIFQEECDYQKNERNCPNYVERSS